MRDRISDWLQIPETAHKDQRGAASHRVGLTRRVLPLAPVSFVVAKAFERKRSAACDVPDCRSFTATAADNVGGAYEVLGHEGFVFGCWPDLSNAGQGPGETSTNLFCRQTGRGENGKTKPSAYGTDPPLKTNAT